MYQTILQFPEQFPAGWELAQTVDLAKLSQKKFRKLYFVGMGGSSLAADLINDSLDGKLNLIPVRDYRLPSDAHHEDLTFVSSYSGNTEETLEALEAALRKDIPTIVLAHGGNLKGLVQEKKLPFLPIPECIQPRCALGYFFAGTMGILERLGLVPFQKKEIDSLSRFLKDRQSFHESTGKEIAAQWVDRVPLIYGPANFYGACRIWKIKLNENAKVQSFFNVFPELNHNEMVGFTRLLMKPALLFLKSQWMHPRVARRMEVMEGLLGAKIPVFNLKLSGENPFQEMFDSLGVADYASFYLAKAYGVDPVPVEMVEDFKKSLDVPDEANHSRSSRGRK